MKILAKLLWMEVSSWYPSWVNKYLYKLHALIFSMISPGIYPMLVSVRLP